MSPWKSISLIRANLWLALQEVSQHRVLITAQYHLAQTQWWRMHSAYRESLVVACAEVNAMYKHVQKHAHSWGTCEVWNRLYQECPTLFAINFACYMTDGTYIFLCRLHPELYIYIHCTWPYSFFIQLHYIYIYNISIYLSLGFATQISEKLEVFEYFGTTARVMLTMFELTLAYLGVGVAREPVDIWCSKVLGFSGRYWPWWLRNWPVAARILQENVTDAKLQGALKMAGIRGWHNGVPCFLLTSSRV